MIDRRKVSLCHQIFVLTLVLGGPAALGSRSAQALAGDWPLWRFDASRRASSEEELPESLKLQWAIQLPEPTPAWPTTQKKLQFDNKYEPILGEGLLFISSMRHDCVTAFDSETGEERWRFYGDGPFRLAPAYWKGRVIAGCDDGHVYCLSAQKGELLWKFRAGASGRRLLGNQRMINTWPVRGAPVIYDDTLYVGAGIWPFMGVFLHALNPEDGSVIWTNSGSGSDFLTQQHNSPAFAGVAPQGYIAATKDRLIVSGGRTLPAVYDRKTGKYVHYNVASRRMGSKGGGGYTVVCGENFYINSGGMYRMDNGKWVLNVDAPVFSQYSMIAVDGSGGLLGYRHGFHEEKFRDKKGKEQTRTVVKKSWSGFLEEKIQELFIKSGSRVYGLGSGNRVLAIDLPRLDRGSRISWSTKLEGKPVSLITGNSRLFVVTDKARLYCYGEAEVKPNL
ncbi:MAG: PQQ-binding-like beta-propeller repeat protein, partial [Planctomycetota bacterium]